MGEAEREGLWGGSVGGESRKSEMSQLESPRSHLMSRRDNAFDSRDQGGKPRFDPAGWDPVLVADGGM